MFSCSIYKSDGLTSILGLCYAYLPGQPSIFYNQTHLPPSPTSIASYFAAIDRATTSMSDCNDVAKELLCYSMFPLCDPTSPTPCPLPVCSQMCGAFTEGHCSDLFHASNSSDLFSLMIAKCGPPAPTGGGLPECIMSSRQPGIVRGKGVHLVGVAT